MSLHRIDLTSIPFQAVLEILRQSLNVVLRKFGTIFQGVSSQRAVGCFGGWEYVTLSMWLELPIGKYVESMFFELGHCDIQRMSILEVEQLYECADPVLHSLWIPL